jgi:hypothetical protein
MFFVYHKPNDQPGENAQGPDTWLTEEEMGVITRALSNTLGKNAAYTWKGEQTRQGNVLAGAIDKLKHIVHPIVHDAQVVGLGD